MDIPAHQDTIAIIEDPIPSLDPKNKITRAILMGQALVNQGPALGDHSERIVTCKYKGGFAAGKPPYLLISLMTDKSDINISGVYRVNRQDEHGFEIVICTTIGTSGGNNQATNSHLSWIAIGQIAKLG